LNDAAGRAAELKKLQVFADTNDLTIELADKKGGVYEGRMGVHTDHLITQNVGGRKLIVHDKALVGDALRPGQDLRIDYSSKTPAVTHMGPTRNKGLSR